MFHPKPLVALLCTLLLFFSCGKENSFQVSTDDPNNPGGGPGAGGNNSWGWSFKDAASASYYGCIDTAYYETVQGFNALAIEGTDSANNYFTILLSGGASGNIKPGNYGTAQGAAMVVETDAGGAYISSQPNTFSIKIVAINDTMVEATFTGNLPDIFGGSPFKVTDGKLRAKIGKPNPCEADDDPGGGGNNGNAKYSLVTVADGCSDFILEGEYLHGKALTNDNTVELEVDVEEEGDWSITTSTVNGIHFSGTGTFPDIGFYTIKLSGQGTPQQYGPTTIPVSAGTSTCGFELLVDTIAVSPCNPANNTASLSGVNDLTFASGASTSTAFGTYKMTANGPGGDLDLEFPGTTQPKPGLHKVELVGGPFLKGSVRISFVASSIYWQCNTGDVYVSINNGKATVTFCELEISGTLGGPSFKSKATGRVTEK